MKLNLRSYLAISFTLIATVPVLVLGSWVEETSMEKELSAVSEKHLLLATNTTAALDRYAQDAKAIFELFIEFPENTLSPAGAALAQKIGFRHISILDQEGSVISQVKVEDEFRGPMNSSAFEKLRLQSGREPTFSNLMLDQTGRPTIYLIKQVTPDRIAIGALNLDYIRQAQSKISFGRKGHSAIVDGIGNVIAHPRSDWQLQMKNIAKVKPVELMMAGKTGVTTFYSPAADKDMVTGYTTVPSTGWGVMVPQPLEELEERAGDVKQVALGLIIIGVAIAALISWLLAGLLVKPVEAVVKASRKLSKGCLDTRVHAFPGGYPSEFRELASSFNTMIREISTGSIEREDAARELKITHEQLERATSKLQSMNTSLENTVYEKSSNLHRETKRRQELGEALQASEVRFKEFAEAASDWFWEMDKNLRWTYLSERFTTVTGIPQDHLLGKTRQESGILIEDEVAYQKHLVDLAAHRPFRGFVHPRALADGRTLYMSINGNPVFDETDRFLGYRGTGSDITEQVQTEKELRRSEQRYKTLYHETPLGVSMEDYSRVKRRIDKLASGGVVNLRQYFEDHDDQLREAIRDIQLLDANTGLIEMFGVSSFEEFKEYEENFEAWQHTNWREHYISEFEALANGMRTFSCEFWDLTLDSSPIGIICTSRVVDGHEDDWAEIITTHEDITERNRIERMQSEFIATVNHELRTPMTSLKGSLELIKSGAAGELPEKLKPMFDIVDNNSHRLIRLIIDFFDIGKIEAGKLKFDMAPVKLGEIVDQAIQISEEYESEFGVTIERSNAAPEATVYGDHDRLIQVISNLISNAAKFSPENGVVTVSLSRFDDGFRIEVTDNGPGVPEEFSNHIFKKFSRADSSDTRQTDGTGLGLYISKFIVEQHGGIIDIKTDDGEGTRASFYLPEWVKPEPVVVEISDLQP